MAISGVAMADLWGAAAGAQWVSLGQTGSAGRTADLQDFSFASRASRPHVAVNLKTCEPGDLASLTGPCGRCAVPSRTPQQDREPTKSWCGVRGPLGGSLAKGT